MLLALSDPEVNSNLDVSAGHIGEEIAASGSKVFGHKILTGLTECGKLIPLKYCPWELTLSVVPDLVGEAFSGAIDISDAQLSVTLLDPTSDVAETLHSHLSNGKELPLHYQSWYCVQQAITANQTLHTSAAKSRLDKVSFTMCGASDKDCRDFRNPGETFEFGLQLGSKRIPEHDPKDRAAFWDMLSRTVGRKNLMDINRVEFGEQTGTAEKKFIVGIPIERMPDQAYTGYSLREGSLRSCTFRNAANVTKAYVCLYYSSVLEVKDSEISQFD